MSTVPELPEDPSTLEVGPVEPTLDELMAQPVWLEEAEASIEKLRVMFQQHGFTPTSAAIYAVAFVGIDNLIVCGCTKQDLQNLIDRTWDDRKEIESEAAREAGGQDAGGDVGGGDENAEAGAIPGGEEGR